MMPYQHILVGDDPSAVRPPAHAEPAREAERAEQRAARRALRRARSRADRDERRARHGGIRGAGSCFSSGYDLSDRTMVYEGQPCTRPAGTGQLAASRRRRLVQDLGPRQAGDRAGPRLVPRGRERARRGVRSRLRRGGRAVRLSAGAPDEPAGHAVPSVARRPAQRDGAPAHGRLRFRYPRRCAWVLANRAFPAAESSRHASSRSPSASRRPKRPPAAQQALGAPRHGDHGRARSDPRRHRRPGAGLPPPKPAAPTCRPSAATAAACKTQLDQRDTTFGDYRTKKE